MNMNDSNEQVEFTPSVGFNSTASLQTMIIFNGRGQSTDSDFGTMIK